jgi:hypoxanthine phosphoribosyltransferase
MNDVLKENMVKNSGAKIVPAEVRAVFAKATCLYSRYDIEAALAKMATQISYELSNTNPLILCVVVGGIIPLGNLLIHLDFPLEVDYVHVSRYGDATSGGKLHWKVKPSVSLAGRTVLIVDDILDGGVTLGELVRYCEEDGAENVYTAVLVDKKHEREAGGVLQADFTGLEAEDRFLFGYGLDYKGYLRNAPGIYAVAAEHEDAE